LDRDRPVRDPRFAIPRAFDHPLWWCALALLLLNDHLLKGAGVLPGAITGKLSDLAGMLVAPPLLAFALGANRRSARRAAVLLVGASLAAIKLAPEAARALEHALALVGMQARVWVDPSDLWALALLPIGHALSAPRAAAPCSLLAGAVRGTAIGLAAFACVATTGDDKKSGGGRTNAPEVENATGEPLTLILASTEGAGGCSLYRDDRVSLLTPDAFVAPRELMLDADERAALPDDTEHASCGAASILLADGSGVMVFWRDLPKIESFAPEADGKREGRRVVISGGAGEYDIDVGEDLDTFEPGGKAPERSCQEPELIPSLEFTPLAAPAGFLELGEVRQAADGCLEVDWFALEADTSPDTQRLCVPDWAFPFEPGEQLAVVQALDPLAGKMLRITRQAGGTIDTQLVIWNDAAAFEGGHVRSVEAVDCVGALSSCGAYVRPLELEVRGRDEPMLAGEEASIDGDDGGETRVLVGPGRDVAWSSSECTGVEARAGSTASVLELRTP